MGNAHPTKYIMVTSSRADPTDTDVGFQISLLGFSVSTGVSSHRLLDNPDSLPSANLLPTAHRLQLFNLLDPRYALFTSKVAVRLCQVARWLACFYDSTSQAITNHTCLIIFFVENKVWGFSPLS